MIVDVHLHYYHDGEPEKNRRRLLQEMDRNGVAVGLVSTLRDKDGANDSFPAAGTVRGANRIAAELARETGDRIRWLAYLNPQNPDWPEELARCVEGGAVGVKLWISLKDEKGSMERTSGVLARAGELGLPVLIHSYNRTWPSERTWGEASVEDVAWLAERNPDTAVVAAHSGGGGWRRSLGVLRGRCPRVLFEVSGSYPERGMVEALVGEVGPERVLFGSDGLGRGIASQIAKVALADLPEADKEAILGKNAARTFRLDRIPSVAPSSELRGPEELPDVAEDHFAFCGRWPFHGTPCPSPADLDALMGGHGVERAFAADLGALFSHETETANLRFLEGCQGCKRLRPLAVLDPGAQNWPTLLRLLPEGFAGALVSPYIHNWRLDDPARRPFFQACADKGLDVWVNCALSDHRFVHPGFAPRPVSGEEILAFARQAPGRAYVFQGAARGDVAKVLDQLGPQSRFRFEISRMTDGTGALAEALAKHGTAPLAMGSEYPFRHPREVLYAAQRA